MIGPAVTLLVLERADHQVRVEARPRRSRERRFVVLDVRRWNRDGADLRPAGGVEIQLHELPAFVAAIRKAGRLLLGSRRQRRAS